MNQSELLVKNLSVSPTHIKADQVKEQEPQIYDLFCGKKRQQS